MAMPLPSVMQQDRYLAIFTSNPPAGGGNGTWDDPFDASDETKFDEIMSNSAKTPDGGTVRLLPGIFKTKGHTGTNSGGGNWAARKMRILGSGMGVTTLKLVGMTTANATRYAVGIPFDAAGTGLDSFELSDLTIDCNLGGGENTGTGGRFASGESTFFCAE
jgi:hypothetical protein